MRFTFQKNPAHRHEATGRAGEGLEETLPGREKQTSVGGLVGHGTAAIGSRARCKGADTAALGMLVAQKNGQADVDGAI